MSASRHSGPIDPAAVIMGMNRILPYAFNGIDIGPVWNELVERYNANTNDAAALVDLSIVLQSQGRTPDARQILDQALNIRRSYCTIHGDGSGLRLLAFVTAGDFMANTPLDFLFENSNGVIWFHYVDAETQALHDLPEHDVAFMAIGESNENGPVLTRMAELLSDWRGPIWNNKPLLIKSLTRDGVNDLLDGQPAILSPKTKRIHRLHLEAVVRGVFSVEEATDGFSFPIIVRPIGTHAGHGLSKADSVEELEAALAGCDTDGFYVAPFIDYRGADGLFNKQRIVLVRGRPYPSHMALSSHWMVHYMNAGMAESPEKRAVEARWMETFDEDFAVRHRAAFASLYQCIGLDYFGIDCAELPDGRLLVFELDVAMIVHALDDAELYPYKKVAMHKLFGDFVAALENTVITQRTDDDCLTCVFAMYSGRSYDEVEAAARAAIPAFKSGGPLTHSLMRRIAHDWGFALVSSLYMDWRYPGIIGVISKTIPDCGHALYWDGQRLIDPGPSGAYDLDYVQSHAIEFTQRAQHLSAVLALDAELMAPQATAVSTQEFF